MIAAELFGFCGAALCGLVGVQLFTTVADSLQRLSSGRTRFRMRNQALQSELSRLSRVASGTESTIAWQGWRKFRVKSKRTEIDGCHSIYLVPHDGKPLPSFKPGQFLTFSIRLPGERKPVVRCYSLSDAPNSVFYRCTVKKVPPREPHPPGVVSSFFNDELGEGDLLDVKAPRGGFCLDMTREDPIVLLAGGVGITPLLSMINTVAATESRRTVHMFCGFQNSEDHLFKRHLELLNENYHNLHIHTAYSAPLETDVQGKDYTSVGYVTLDLLKEKLPSNNFEFFMCGPGPFMNSLDSILKGWGVPADSIHSEAFGPASIAKPKPTKSAPGVAKPKAPETVAVRFARSDVTVHCDPSETLLDLAEKHSVTIDSGCRAGNCGTCAVAVKNGEVKYTQAPDADVEDGTCLTCIATPESDLELDA